MSLIERLKNSVIRLKNSLRERSNKKLEEKPKNERATGNPYLVDPDKGLQLVSQIISSGQRLSTSKKDSQIDEIIDDMFARCETVALAEESKLVAELKNIVERLKRPSKYRLLQGKSVIGVGGQYSAGKSRFLNSLLDDDGASLALPENVSPSTSVATYIMRDTKKEWIQVCNRSDTLIKLNAQALEAISHDFNETYKLNLAQYVNFIAVGTPHLIPQNVALLDTPGYSKPKGQDSKELTDYQRALCELSSVDRLIWLIDASNGTINTEDIKFIKSLYKDSEGYMPEILIVVNQCDRNREIYTAKDPQKAPTIVQIQTDAQNAGLAVSAVVPYSAKFPEWAQGRNKVLAFLKQVADSQDKIADLKAQFEDIVLKIKRSWDEADKHYDYKFRYVTDIIQKADAPFNLSSLARYRGYMGRKLVKSSIDREEYSKYKAQIEAWIDDRLK